MNALLKKFQHMSMEFVPAGLNGTSQVRKHNNQKFAELIIEECCKLLIAESQKYEKIKAELSPLIAQTYATAAEKVKNHFGESNE